MAFAPGFDARHRPREGGCLRPYRWHAGAPADRPTGLGTRGYPGRPRHAPKNSVTLRSAQTPRGRRVPARWRLERCDKLPPPTAARRHRSPSSPRCTGRHTWDPNRTRCLRARRPPHRRVTHEPAPGPGSPRPLAFHYPATAPADPDHPQLRQPEPARAHQAGADPHLPEPVELVVHRGGEQPAVGERQDPVEGVAG